MTSRGRRNESEDTTAAQRGQRAAMDATGVSPAGAVPSAGPSRSRIRGRKKPPQPSARWGRLAATSGNWEVGFGFWALSTNYDLRRDLQADGIRLAPFLIMDALCSWLRYCAFHACVVDQKPAKKPQLSGHAPILQRARGQVFVFLNVLLYAIRTRDEHFRWAEWRRIVRVLYRWPLSGRASSSQRLEKKDVRTSLRSCKESLPPS